MGPVVEIWLESLISIFTWDSRKVHWSLSTVEFVHSWDMYEIFPALNSDLRSQDPGISSRLTSSHTTGESIWQCGGRVWTFSKTSTAKPKKTKLWHKLQQIWQFAEIVTFAQEDLKPTGLGFNTCNSAKVWFSRKFENMFPNHTTQHPAQSQVT